MADGASGLLRCSEWLITNAHDLTGAPWCVSIPLAALAVGLAIRTPLAYYAHQRARKRAKLAPLIMAQTAMIGRGLRKKSVPNLQEAVAEVMKKRSKTLVDAFAGNERKSILAGLITLPVFICNLEVLRRMCGGPKGVLGTFIFGDSTAEDSTSSAATTIPTEAVSASSASATDLAEAVASTPSDFYASITIEPTFATEGCLWFPNLLQADPLHILPFALSAVLVAHMIPETSAARRELFGLRPVSGDKHAVLMGQSRKRRAFQRTIFILALAMGPITMDMPAAMHMYWLASSGTSLAVSKGLKRALPIQKTTLRPCTGVEMPFLRPKPKATAYKTS